MKNYFYVEIAGSPCLFEKTVVVGGEHKFCAFYVDSRHAVADEKSRGGWSWILGGPSPRAHSGVRYCAVLKGKIRL